MPTALCAAAVCALSKTATQQDPTTTAPHSTRLMHGRQAECQRTVYRRLMPMAAVARLRSRASEQLVAVRPHEDEAAALVRERLVGEEMPVDRREQLLDQARASLRLGSRPRQGHFASGHSRSGYF